MNIRTAKPVRGRINTYYVQGLTDEYIVRIVRHSISHRKVVTCNCMDFTVRRSVEGGTCKHIDTVLSQYPQALTSVPKSPKATTQNTPLTAKSVLALVVSVLNANTIESEHLWNILTALRGPDNGSTALKEETTCAIRGAIGLVPSSHGAMINHKPLIIENYFHDSYEKAYLVLSRFKPQGHFLGHYTKAAVALEAIGLV